MDMSRADNSDKSGQNLPISNPKPDLHNINEHTKFWENSLILTEVIIQTQNTNERTELMQRQPHRRPT